MTEAMPIDVSGKIISNAKPAAPSPAGPTGAAKPPEKPGGKGTAGDAPPAPGSKTFLGWVAGAFSRKQLTIAAAALCSLAAGIAAVSLLWPMSEQPTAATQALVSDPSTSAPDAPVTPPRTGPTLTLEPARPAEFIPPASLPMSPVSPATRPSEIPPPSSLDTLPAIPSVPTGVLAPARPPEIAPPGSLVPAVLPAGGTDSKLPTIPSSPGSTLPTTPPAGPLLPALPGTPSIAPSGAMNSNPSPPAPIVGMPPSLPAPPSSLVPSVEERPKPPAAPAELSPLLPAIPGSGGTGATGEKIEYVKPAESSSVTPAAATRAPTTSYDVDIYHPKANDTWESISREYFSDPKYAAALRAYNQNRALAPGREIDVPPLHVLRRMTPPPPVAGTPATRTAPPQGDPWNAAGIGTVSARTYRVPPGDGMSLPAVAKLVLGNDQRWRELYDLNPDVNPSKVTAGTELKLPADARVQ